MQNKIKFYVTKNTSKKGSAYFLLYADLGYRKQNLSFDTSLCAELLGISVQEAFKLEDGFIKEV